MEALRGILKGGGRPKDVLLTLPEGMERRDRAFVMELVYGVLRNRDELDFMLSKLMSRPSGVPFATLNNLRAGIYQIFHMRVPDWAAVNEAVELEGRHRGLVNGVLRNALRKRSELESTLLELRAVVRSTNVSEAVRAISTLTSHPSWLVRRWVRRMGQEEAMSLALANNEVPPLTLRVNTLRATREELMLFLRQKGIACEQTPVSPDGIRLEGTVPFDEIGIRGLALVQDEAAQLVGLLLSPSEGMRVLDACAAPGGKTTHLAALMRDRGEVVALDVDGPRLEKLMENVEALELKSVRVLQADLTVFEDDKGFDAVLLDAPCTATGVIRRNPDVKYRRKRADLMEYAETQYSLLTSAAGLLRRGGRLVYAVCSTEPEEGEMVVERFLKSFPDFDIIGNAPFSAPLLFSGGRMRTWPHLHGMDGFYAAALMRKEAS